VLGWQAFDTDEPPPVVATATLGPLADPEATGTASIAGAGGERELTVNLDSASEHDGFLEVWLLSPDASGLVSLGVLRGDTATFPVPDGLDLGEFPVVDISVEPFDGDPSHSGDSVVRGTLDDA
jgi:anti-sigma-K factor RskA